MNGEEYQIEARTSCSTGGSSEKTNVTLINFSKPPSFTIVSLLSSLPANWSRQISLSCNLNIYKGKTIQLKYRINSLNSGHFWGKKEHALINLPINSCTCDKKEHALLARDLFSVFADSTNAPRTNSIPCCSAIVLQMASYISHPRTFELITKPNSMM